MIEFLSGEIWSEIKKCSNNAKMKKVVVPYFSNSAGILFGQNDTLVVDASKRAIQTGQTDAKLLEKYFNNGCKIFSNSNLHAKIYLFDNVVFIGSNNLSNNSITSLVEASVKTTSVTIRSNVLQMISQLAKSSISVDEKFIQQIKKIPVEKHFWKTKKSKPKITIPKPRSWIIYGGEDEEYPGDEEKVEKRAEKLRKDFKNDIDEGLSLEWIFYPGNSNFNRTAKIGDLIFYINKPTLSSEDLKNIYVTKAGTIVDVTKEKGRKNLRVYHCLFPNEDVLYWKDFLKATNQANMNYKFHPNMQRELDFNKSQILLDIWNSFT